MKTKEDLVEDLIRLGLKKDDIVMVHSSYKSLGEIDGGAKTIFDAFFIVLGEGGTLMLPGLSYETVGYDNPLFDINETKTCVGYLPEYFRTNVSGVIRSMHATHSILLKGKMAKELAMNHELDLTPVGPNSPLRKLVKLNGKILFLGCSPDHNTLFHGIEEMVEPPYLFDREHKVNYILKNKDKTIHQTAIHHNFKINGYYYEQRYSRIVDYLNKDEYSYGKVLDAECYLLSSKAVWDKGIEKLKENPYFFVEPIKL